MDARNQRQKSLFAEVVSGYEHVRAMLADPAIGIAHANCYYGQAASWFERGRYDIAALLFELAEIGYERHNDPMQYRAATRLDEVRKLYRKERVEKRTRAEPLLAHVRV